MRLPFPVDTRGGLAASKGGAMIGALVAILMAGVLGAGAASILGTSAMHEVRANHGERAYYLAESGFRYAASMYRNDPDPTKAAFWALNGQTITTPDGGQFTLQVIPNTATSRQVAGNQTVGPRGNVSLAAGPAISPRNGTFVVNGQEYRYREFTNDTLVDVVGSDNISPFPLVFAGGETLNFLPVAQVSSTGQFPGPGQNQNVARTITYSWRPSGGTGGPAPENLFNAVTGRDGITFDQFDHFADLFDFDAASASFSVGSVETQWGANSSLKVDELVQNYVDPALSGCQLEGMGNTFMLLRPDRFADAFRHEWHVKDQRLEYDIQVKLKWGWAELYGATGIVFRWHPVSGGKHAGYGLSFMRYRGSHCDDIEWDRLPNSLKPYPASWATLVDDWFGTWNSSRNRWDNTVRMQGAHKQNSNKNLHTLIVLWEQYVENGQERRRWLAYKDLGMVALVIRNNNWEDYEKRDLSWWIRPNGLAVGTLEYDRYVLGLQPDWEWDGVHINDLSTLGVRVKEVVENQVKKNQVQVFYGDASTWYTSRSQSNSIPYDKENLRSHRALPSQVLLDEASPHHTGTWPVWPPEHLSDWTHDDDRYTVIGRTSNNQYLQWDGINPAASQVAWVSPDTLVLTRFTSPSSLAAWSNRQEIGLHAFGNFGHRSPHSPHVDNEYAVFDDFSFRFLHTSSGQPQEYKPPLQK